MEPCYFHHNQRSRFFSPRETIGQPHQNRAIYDGAFKSVFKLVFKPSAHSIYSLAPVVLSPVPIMKSPAGFLKGVLTTSAASTSSCLYLFGKATPSLVPNSVYFTGSIAMAMLDCCVGEYHALVTYPISSLVFMSNTWKKSLLYHSIGLPPTLNPASLWLTPSALIFARADFPTKSSLRFKSTCHPRPHWNGLISQSISCMNDMKPPSIRR